MIMISQVPNVKNTEAWALTKSVTDDYGIDQMGFGVLWNEETAL